MAYQSEKLWCHLERRLLRLMAISEETSQYVHQEICWAAMTTVFNLGNVFQLLICRYLATARGPGLRWDVPFGILDSVVNWAGTPPGRVASGWPAMIMRRRLRQARSTVWCCPPAFIHMNWRRLAKFASVCATHVRPTMTRPTWPRDHEALGCSWRDVCLILRLALWPSTSISSTSS